MLNFEQKEWYNKDDPENQSIRTPISASQLNRIEAGVAHSVDGVNNMFNHWWKKKKLVSSEITQTTADYTTYTFYFGSEQTSASKYYYADSYSVKIKEGASDVSIELSEPVQSIDLSYNGYGTSALKGKYFMSGAKTGHVVYYMANDGSLTRAISGNRYGLNFVKTLKFTSSVVYGDVEYIWSDKENAYKQGWNSNDESLYDYIGIPFETARDGVRVEAHSYVGTGGDVLELFFNGIPQIVFLQGNFLQPILSRNYINYNIKYSDSNETILCDWRETNSLRCTLSSTLQSLFNAQGTTYKCMAITL